MSSPKQAPSGSEPDDTPLSRSYAAVVVIQVGVLLGLYWLGRHFG
jgi:hypothetical protein